jgi:hypothetical protein
MREIYDTAGVLSGRVVFWYGQAYCNILNTSVSQPGEAVGWLRGHNQSQTPRLKRNYEFSTKLKGAWEVKH